MARVGRRGGPNWVWPLTILLIVMGLALLAFAFLAPPAPSPQTTEQPEPFAQTEPIAAPTEPVAIRDIASDPFSYFGQTVTVEGRISRMVGDRGVFVTDREGGTAELLTLLDRPITEAGLRQDDIVRPSGTIMEVTPDELARLEPIVDKPTSDALAQAQSYLLVGTFERLSP